MEAPDRSRPGSPRRRADYDGERREYVVDAENVHPLTQSLETYARDKHYTVLYDASIWAPFDRLLAEEPFEKPTAKGLLNLQVFYGEVQRIIESYENALILPEIRIELSNLIASGGALLDRMKLRYQQLSATKKDRAAKTFSTILRIDETLKKLRARIEERVRGVPPQDAKVLETILELVKASAETLQLKKPDAAVASDVDERLVARALYELLWSHRYVAIYTRDEDVRRIVSTVYKLMVSQTIRDESVTLVVKALQLGNLVVLKYNAEREQYSRFFESQTHQEIGDFIFSKMLPERAKVKLLTVVRTCMARLGKLLLERQDDGVLAPSEPAVRKAEVGEALALVHERMVWYQEVARAVGVSDVHAELRVTEAFLTVAESLRQDELARAVLRTREGLLRRRMSLVLLELEQQDERLKKELASLTEGSRFAADLKASERLGQVAAEIAMNARERHFFGVALGRGDFHLTRESFRRAEELLQRLDANGHDLRGGDCEIPPDELADLCGKSYQAILRLASEHDLVVDGGLVRLDMPTLIRHLL